MPDTGERREIKSRANAREAELVSESRKLEQKSKEKQETIDPVQKKRVKRVDVARKVSGTKGS